MVAFGSGTLGRLLGPEGGAFTNVSSALEKTPRSFCHVRTGKMVASYEPASVESTGDLSWISSIQNCEK